MGDRQVVLGGAVARDGRIEARMRVGDRSLAIWFSSEEVPLAPAVDAFFPIVLIAAMRARAERLVVEAPVSARLLAAVPALQRQLCEWWTGFGAVEVDAAAVPAESDRSGPRPAAVCFSGGLDSLYTALRHRAEVGALVHVRQYEFLAHRRPRRAIVEASVRGAAARIERPLIAIDTNLREHGDVFGLWTWLHGAAMAAVGQLLRAHCGRLLIASSHSEPETAELMPWGTHPGLDALWSTEAVEIVHDAARVPRIEKLIAVAQSPAAREHLLVCHASTETDLNCGRCEKCIRTRIAIRIAGLEGVFATLPPSVSLLRAATCPLWLHYPRANLRAARAAGQRALAGALAVSIPLGRVRRAAARLRGRVNQIGTAARSWSR